MMATQNMIGFASYMAIGEIVTRKLREFDEEAYGFLDEILAEAKRDFGRDDAPLLPKTPSSKRTRRKIGGKRTTKEKKETEQPLESTMSSVDEEEEQEMSTPPQTGRTRAATRATTTSTVPTHKRNTRANSKAKENLSKSQESPVLCIANVLNDSVDRDANADVKNQNERLNPVCAKAIPDQVRTPQSGKTTRTHSNKEDSDVCNSLLDEEKENCTVKECETRLGTAEHEKPSVLTTPQSSSTSANIRKVSQAKIVLSPSPKKKSLRTISVIKQDSGLNERTRSSGHRTAKGRRSSVRKSLKTLPSDGLRKSLTKHKEESIPEKSPVKKSRTRLRLKKKDQPPEEVKPKEVVSSDEMTASETTDNETADREGDHSQEAVEGDHSPETVEIVAAHCPASEEKVFSDREKKARTSARLRSRSKTSASGSEERMEVDSDYDSGQDPVKSVDGMNSNDDAKDSGVSVATASMPAPRVTRSKMRKATVSDSDTEENFAVPEGLPPRNTRTKTRKRQHEEESDSDTIDRKRSCTEQHQQNKTPDRKGPRIITSTDEESSEDECPPLKVVRPHPASFLNNLQSNKSVNLTPGIVRSFIKRNTPPPKLTRKEILEKKKEELAEKEKKELERLKKRDEDHRKRMEELKRKREENMRRVAAFRERREQQEQEKRNLLRQKMEEKRQQTDKIREEKQREDKEKQIYKQRKLQEAEERRKQEEEERLKKILEQQEEEKRHQEMLQRKKEFEEQKRQKKIALEKKRQAEKLLEIEKERQAEQLRLKHIEEEKEREWQKKREEREKALAKDRAEKERLELERKRERDLMLQQELERMRELEKKRLAEELARQDEEQQRQEELKKMTAKHNQTVQHQQQQQLNRTMTLNTSANLTHNQSYNPESYDMTPGRPKKRPPTLENYDISDLHSEDSTDDEDQPRKRIPNWARGEHFKAAIINQHRNPPDLDEIFWYMDVPDLNVLFPKKRERFNKRTSSANWDSPMLKPVAGYYL